MRYAVVYASRTGNTELLAKSVYSEVKNLCVYFGEPNEKAFEADVIFTGFWTDRGSCSSEIAEFLKSLERKRIFLFGTAGFGKDKSYFGKVLGEVKKNIASSNEIIGEYMCQGKMPISVRERYETLPMPKKKQMIENFDEGLSHPNEQDLEKLRLLVRALK